MKDWSGSIIGAKHRASTIFLYTYCGDLYVKQGRPLVQSNQVLVQAGVRFRKPF